VVLYILAGATVRKYMFTTSMPLTIGSFAISLGLTLAVSRDWQFEKIRYPIGLRGGANA
jgi:hypothetical protein